MRFPKDDSYVAGWEWAGDALTWSPKEEVLEMAQSAAMDMGTEDPEMAHEGILDRCNSR